MYKNIEKKTKLVLKDLIDYKSDRQRKGLADEMSAVIILTTWLETH